jgi:cytochrome c peroxidase
MTLRTPWLPGLSIRSLLLFGPLFFGLPLFGLLTPGPDAASAQTIGFDDPILHILPQSPPERSDNPGNALKIELGRKLFFDRQLSSDKLHLCASCHNPEGVVTPLPTNYAEGSGARHRDPPTILNAAFQSALYWDGRAGSLEAQVNSAIAGADEMGLANTDEFMRRIRANDVYRQQFAKIFKKKSPVTMDSVTKVIAAYERTLLTPGTAFDRWAKGEKSALTPEQKRGFALFTAVGCNMCHFGPNFSGPTSTHGEPFLQQFPVFADSAYIGKYDLMADEGRKTSTARIGDAHLFRVPTLRNVERTAPYFHNGKVATLKEAVLVMAQTQLGRSLSDDDANLLVAFLCSLTGPGLR